MRVLLALNSFKECANSPEVVSLLKEKLKKYARIDVLPLTDGGDGFLEVCRKTFDLGLEYYSLQNLYNEEQYRVPIGYSDRERCVYLESAEIIGLKKVPPGYRNPRLLNSENVGQVIRRILHRKHHIKKIVLGLGGTATSDLGLGACKPFGLKLLDRNDHEIPPHPGLYENAFRVVLPRRISVALEAVLDVQVPLTGKNGPALLFAGQKGASAAVRAALERGAKNILRILQRDHAMNFSREKLGAGGGLGLGLSLLANMNTVPSYAFLYRTFALKNKIRQSDVIITGEGRYDRQSLLNKATGVVLREALRQKKQAVLVAGTINNSVVRKHNGRVIALELRNYFSSEEESIRKFKEGIDLASMEIIRLINRQN